MFKLLTWRPDTPWTDNDKPAPTIVMRFRTRGHAEVHVLQNHHIHCQGCDHTDPSRRSTATARAHANAHAAGCWAMPKPATDA